MKKIRTEGRRKMEPRIGTRFVVVFLLQTLLKQREQKKFQRLQIEDGIIYKSIKQTSLKEQNWISKIREMIRESIDGRTVHDRDGRILYFIHELLLQTLQSHITTQHTLLSLTQSLQLSGEIFSIENLDLQGKSEGEVRMRIGGAGARRQ